MDKTKDRKSGLLSNCLPYLPVVIHIVFITILGIVQICNGTKVIKV